MNYDDYVNHIVQKYRLAVSLAVIKTKPVNLTLEEYMQQLRNKINEEKMTTDDLNVSIRSEDFRIDETYDSSIDIDENNDKIDNNNDEIHQPEMETDEMNQKIDVNRTEITNMQDLGNLTIDIDGDNGNRENFESFIDENDVVKHQNKTNDVETLDLNDSITILQNFDDGNANFNENNTESILKDVMEIMKSIDDSLIKGKEISNKISTDNDNNLTRAPERMDIAECNENNDATLCESIDILSNTEAYDCRQKHIFALNDSQSFNHKERQIRNGLQMIDASNNLPINSKDIDENKKINKYNTNNVELCNTKKSLGGKPKMIESNPQSKIKEYRHKKEFKNIYQNVAHIFDTKTYNPKEEIAKQSIKINVTTEKFKETPKDTEDVTIYSIPDDLTCKTHYSESQIDNIIIIDDKYIHQTRKNDNQDKNESVFQKDMEINDCSKHTQKNFSMNNSQNYNAILTNNEQATEKYTNISIGTDIFSQESQSTNIFALSTNSSLQFNNYSNKEPNKSLEGQCNEFSNAKSRVKFIDNDLFSQESQLACFSGLPNNHSQNLTENSLMLTQDAQNMDGYFDQVTIQRSQNSIINHEKVNDATANESCIAFDKINNAPQVKNCAESNNFDNDLKNRQVTNEFRTEQLMNCEMGQVKDRKSCTDLDNNLDDSQAIPIPNFDEINKSAKDCNKSDDNLQNMEVDLTESQTEFIPFKVIEELNKIKIYLKKRDEKKLSLESYSSDTGYKSDSQSKNSLKLSQSSIGWLDQSAHSIFSYILECPLMLTTKDITDEISMVLGQLIDKLHEDERYPTFLEELLDSVHMLLGIVHSDNTGENVFQLMKKEETIQRIIVLNKSIHIQKYTIEKITHILENLHTDLTSNDLTYEITNIDKIENICYIFHLLELILEKYNKTTQNLSQSTQDSQEKVLKKSDIMDIWRKKWNTSYKGKENEGSSETKSILPNCSAVLNKLVVDCIERYSLISYFALKCFNAMQT